MSSEQQRIFIGLGSNLGDSAETILQAWVLLGEEDGIECVRLSDPYMTAPVDMHSQHWFTNCVGELRTTLSPHRLLARLMAVETALGRVRGEGAFGYEDRPIDLDLIYYGEVELDEPDLDLPHPHLYNRLFVLTPLCEIAPEFFDIKYHVPVQELESRLIAKIEQGLERKQSISRSSWDSA